MPHFSVDNLVTRTLALPRLFGDAPAQALVKTASDADTRIELSKLGIKGLHGHPFDIRPKHAYLFVISLGSGDRYSANDNADWYPENDGLYVEAPEPCDPNIRSMVLGKGLRSCHGTFKVHGAVYRNHKTEPEHNVPRSGEIVWQRWNDNMHRGELILELPESKWEKELALEEQGVPLMWSQGNGTPSDFCSRCLFKFTPKSKQRCSHIRLNKLCVGDDGVQNVLYCPDPVFYDISYVGNNPAEKIAAALLRIASPEHSPSRRETFRISKFARHSAECVVHALSDAERHMGAEETEAHRGAFAPDVAKDLEFVRIARAHEPGQVLAVLHRLEIILTPSQFARIFCQSEPMGVGGFLDSLPGIFGELAGNGADLDDAGYYPAEKPDPDLLRKLAPFAADFGADSVARKPVLVIRAASPQRILRPTEAGRRLANEYAKYLNTCLTMYGGPALAGRYAGITAAGL